MVVETLDFSRGRFALSSDFRRRGSSLALHREHFSTHRFSDEENAPRGGKGGKGEQSSRRRRRRRSERRKADGQGGRRTGRERRTAGQTTPALLDHADTVAKARLHHPSEIDTSIVPRGRNGKGGRVNAASKG